ncbi:MAG: hypothetical protein QOE90_2002 [Thermoplasmata archaeon]|jgi:uncharacterized protein (DUF58 family)|nr:hypothetical protein [Thermoplasmata archaeon]
MAKERTGGDVKGLAPFGRAMATAGCALLVAGLAFGDYPYLLCALFLLGLVLWARGHAVPGLSAKRALSRTELRAGDPLDVSVEARHQGKEPVALSLHDKVPDAFELQTGANFGVAWVAPGQVAALRYRLRPPRRGTHPVGALRVTTYDPLFLQSAPVTEPLATEDITVHPRTPPAPRIRTSAAWGRTMLPGGDKASRGIQTNDFRELRPYAKGDPLKSVNWKATARESRGELKLIVNDYEVEGKKVVWLFVDASPYTVGGTSDASLFDELASGALSVAGHYLDQGHRVGFTLFGAGQTRLLYADGGETQERRMAALLATAQPGEEGEPIAKAVEATKGFLAREKPLIFAFTLAGRDPALARALISARALASTGRRPAPVVCVTPIVADDGSVAARIVAVEEKAQLKGLERRGITVLRYHPSRAPLQALLAKGVLR